MEYKINYLYRRPVGSMVAPWVTGDGILESLKRQNLLNYEFDCVRRGDECDFRELKTYPVFIVRGYDPRFHSTIDRIYGEQTLGMMETETSNLRADFGPMAFDGFGREYARKFDVIFVASKKDMKDYYGQPQDKMVYYRYFVDTTMVKNVCAPKYDELTYIGTPLHREKFLEESKVKSFVSPSVTNFKDTAMLYVDNICKHKFLVAPHAKSIRIMTARAYEIMACERVAFIQVDDMMLEEDDITPLRDGENCVLFRSIPELREKYEFYKNNPSLSDAIGKEARKTVLEHYDLDKWINYFVEKIYERSQCRV